MAETDELVELLFFDTFSHEINEDINLDLVQFPKPVYITEIRIIPLGARVQADFPGGVRLGATNPSKFGIEFFVNDLGKPGACTFERLGNLEYNQNNCIHLECHEDKIPTDGLVLRGWYTTITLAVYGTLTKNISEPIASPPPIEPPPEEVTIAPVPITATEETTKENQQEWREEVTAPPQPTTEVFEREVYQESPFEENFEPSTFNEESNFYQSSSQDGTRDIEKKSSRRRSPSSERSSSRNRTYSRSDSNEREYLSRQKREWSRSPDYRHSRRSRRDRSREPELSEREHKRPRTPPPQIDSPRRPRSPEHSADSDGDENFDSKQKQKGKLESHTPKEPTSESQTPQRESTEDIQEPQSIDDEVSQDEPFEPILSDDEIVGDDDAGNEEPENEDLEMDDDFDDAIKFFDPFKMEINRYETDLTHMYSKDCDFLIKIFKMYTIQTKCDNKEQFLTSTADEKENFVHISEQIVTNFNTFKRSDLILEQFFKNQDNNLHLMSNVLKIAMDFECACSQLQPGYKIRHIKIGARLTEVLGISEDFIKYSLNVANCDPFKELLDLYGQDYMALSIKLMILKSIYSLLDTRTGAQHFLHNKLNGYQRLLLMLQSNPLTRAKFAIKSILEKLNLYEALENVRDLVTKNLVLTNQYSDDDSYAKMVVCLKEVINALCTNKLSFQQPKRFLPVAKKFEIIKDIASERCWSHMLSSYFKIHALAESLLVIVSNQNFIPAILLDKVFDLIECLTQSPIGIDYFIENAFETTQILVKCLLEIDVGTFGENSESEQQQQKEEEEGEIDEKEKVRKEPTRAVTRAQKLGVHLAFAIQSRYHIDAISHIKDNPDLLVEHLHSLYSQTCYQPGRKHTVQTIGMNNNIVPLLNLIEKERKLQAQRQEGSPGVKYKSPVLSYSVDLLDCIVRHCTNLEYLIDNGHVLLDLVKNHEIFEPSVSAVLQEMSVYLKPFEAISNFSYDDITPLCNVIKRSIEYITTFPGDLIMSLRILQYLAIADEHINSESETKELKHRYVILQFYSSDGVVTLLNILEKLNVYFEQPGLHSPTLMTVQATHTCQIILPAIRILREMLSFVIQCRDIEFKDLTAIEHLMKTYFLMHYYPELSQAYDEAQKVKSEIIKTLLAYTQPNQQDQQSIHKSLWTQMIHEVIKCILNGPSTFIPGLQSFAELLPLPLPVPVLKPLTEAECQRLITERKLWSAHLHPESPRITELIQTICPSSFPQLSDLLIRVCLQLADLAPNMTLLVSKTVTDLISTECVNSPGVGTAALARYLKFLGQLTAYASVKISSLSIFSGKLNEYFNQILCNVTEQSVVHLQCQKNIYQILENFFDSEISMIATNSSGNLELNLSCALPSREIIPGLVGAVVTNLLGVNVNKDISTVALRILVILTEHDVTFFHLRKALYSKKDEFRKWIQKVIENFESPEANQDLLSTLIIFFRALIQIDESTTDLIIPNRTMNLTIQDLIDFIGVNDENQNPFIKLKKSLEKQETKNEGLIQDLKNFLELIENPMETENDSLQLIEPVLPQAEGIVTQYQSRLVYAIYETFDDSQLTANYWLEPLRLDSFNEEVLSQLERIPCDLSEMATSCLPTETNLSSDCKRVLHLSASPQSNRDRTATAPCFRTRRVEVEPTTGRPEKKIYVSPMRGRGFPRAPPTRGDLFRSRPPNTSRPPSLHVDDFLALETCGAQPTGPTGYNKLSRDIISIRGTRARGRGLRIAGAANYRTGSPGTWQHVDPNAPPPPQHFRTATSEPVVTPHFATDPIYSQPHFGVPPIRARGRGRVRTFIR